MSQRTVPFCYLPLIDRDKAATEQVCLHWCNSWCGFVNGWWYQWGEPTSPPELECQGPPLMAPAPLASSHSQVAQPRYFLVLWHQDLPCQLALPIGQVHTAAALRRCCQQNAGNLHQCSAAAFLFCGCTALRQASMLHGSCTWNMLVAAWCSNAPRCCPVEL